MTAKLRNCKTISMRWILLGTKDIQKHRFGGFSVLAVQISGLTWETCRWHTDYKKHGHAMLSTALWFCSETTSMVNPATADILLLLLFFHSEHFATHTKTCLLLRCNTGWRCSGEYSRESPVTLGKSCRRYVSKAKGLFLEVMQNEGGQGPDLKAC